MKSLMFVPSKPKMLGKIAGSEADACIVDLEDSIREDEKERALRDALEFLRTDCGKTVFVRVNGGRLKEEIPPLAATGIRGFMLPKFEGPERYDEVRAFLEEKEVIALVETPMGIVDLRRTAQCPFVDGIAFGAEDFTSSIGMKNCAEGLNYARSSIVTYGRAFGKAVYDTPSFVIDDEDALEKEIQIAVDMGFDGKLAINPKQIAKINQMFSYYDLENIRSVVEQYEASGEAVLKIGEHVYEKMHIAHFKKILKERGR